MESKRPGKQWGVFLKSNHPLFKFWVFKFDVYFDEIYQLYWEHFAKFCILVEISANNHDFMVVLWFHYENRLVGNFHYYIRNQRVEIRKYGEFEGNWKVYLFGTAPIMGFGSFLFKYHFSRKIMVRKQKCVEH